MKVHVRDKVIDGDDYASKVVDIGDGIAVSRVIDVIAEDVDGCTVDLTAEYDSTSGRYEVRELVVKRADERPITSEVLRKVPVAKILREGAMRSLLGDAVFHNSDALGPVTQDSAGPTDQTLRRLALIYRMALLAGDAPTQAVAGNLQIPRSTAGQWVTRARDRGFLTVQDPRGNRRQDAT